MITTLHPRVLNKYKNPYFVETGTGSGDCVRLAIATGFEKVFSVELDPDRQEKNISKFKDFIAKGRVVLMIGDSILELPKILDQLDKPATFWLDAHVDEGPCGLKKCPLYEELDAIGKNPIKQHTILIDDMRILGQHWGTGITKETLIEKLKQINNSYKISFEDGYEKDDILVAHF